MHRVQQTQNKKMKNNSFTISIVSPRVNNINPLQKFNFMTLDYTANNQQNKEGQEKTNYMSKTLYNQYDNKKFKIRAPVQSVKTARIRSYEPFQRIKKVEELIIKQKQKQAFFQQQIYKRQLVLNSLSPKNKILQKLLEKDNILKLHRHISNKNSNENKQKQANEIDKRITQIQGVIKKQKNKRQSHVKEIRLDTAVVQRRQDRLKIQNIQFDSVNLNGVNLKQNQFSQRVKNTRKLNQRSKNKRKCNNYSLLSRINKLNEYQQNVMYFQSAKDSKNQKKQSIQPNLQNYR